MHSRHGESTQDFTRHHMVHHMTKRLEGACLSQSVLTLSLTDSCLSLKSGYVPRTPAWKVPTTLFQVSMAKAKPGGLRRSHKENTLELTEKWPAFQTTLSLRTC